jgi:hypothetical protein
VAIYTTTSTRRRRLGVLVAVGFVLGAMLGVVGGRLTASTVEDRVAEVRKEALAVSAQLRVLSLHSEAGAISLGAGGGAGAALALRRANDQLDAAFAQAPWTTAAAHTELRQRLAELERAAPAGAATPEFGHQVDEVAADVDRTFGNSG